jgi:hypothetical protein
MKVVDVVISIPVLVGSEIIGHQINHLQVFMFRFAASRQTFEYILAP